MIEFEIGLSYNVSVQNIKKSEWSTIYQFIRKENHSNDSYFNRFQERLEIKSG